MTSTKGQMSGGEAAHTNFSKLSAISNLNSKSLYFFRRFPYLEPLIYEPVLVVNKAGAGSCKLFIVTTAVSVENEKGAQREPKKAVLIARVQ